MADPAFWRELAATFLLVPGHEFIRADGQYEIRGGKPWRFQLAGNPNEFIRNTFKTLATRGAFEIATAGTTDLVAAWLEEIRKEGINFRTDKIATEVNADGGEGSQYLLGTIFRVFEASAMLCGELEARAVQAKFDEKHRNDAPSIEQPTADDQPKPISSPSETIATQLQRLRDECRWTIPQLAEAAKLSNRQVARHLSGEFKPLPRKIMDYELAFSKRLKRKVVIKTNVMNVS